MKITINITGGAYLQVKKPDDTNLYTLGRQFHTDLAGVLVTECGYVLINQITIPEPLNDPLDITPDGYVRIYHNGIWTSMGQIVVVGFEHPELLEEAETGYYKATTGSGSPQIGTAGTPPFDNTAISFWFSGGRKDRVLAVLNLHKLQKINDFVAKMRGIEANMSAHPDIFPNPQPALSTFAQNIDALVAAEAKTKTGLIGSIEERNIAYRIVVKNVHGLQNYVQIIADNADDHDDALNIVAASGFDIKKRGTYTKAELTAKAGEQNGSIKLLAKAVNGAGAYEWEMSYDGLQWIRLPVTLQANTTIAGLNPGETAYFRVRAVTRYGEAEWSQNISIFVT